MAQSPPKPEQPTQSWIFWLAAVALILADVAVCFGSGAKKSVVSVVDVYGQTISGPFDVHPACDVNDRQVAVKLTPTSGSMTNQDLYDRYGVNTWLDGGPAGFVTKDELSAEMVAELSPCGNLDYGRPSSG